MRIEHREDGYWVDRAEAGFEPVPARWNAKLIPITGYLQPLPQRVGAAYAAITEAAREVSPQDPSFTELACRHGHGSGVTSGEVRAVLNMRVSELLPLIQGLWVGARGDFYQDG
jgi:hypothetical protein